MWCVYSLLLLEKLNMFRIRRRIIESTSQLFRKSINKDGNANILRWNLRSCPSGSQVHGSGGRGFTDDRLPTKCSSAPHRISVAEHDRWTHNRRSCAWRKPWETYISIYRLIHPHKGVGSTFGENPRVTHPLVIGDWWSPELNKQ